MNLGDALLKEYRIHLMGALSELPYWDKLIKAPTAQTIHSIILTQLEKFIDGSQ